MGTSGGVVGLLISYCLTLDEDIRQTLAAHVELQSHLISIERCLSFIKYLGEFCVVSNEFTIALSQKQAK